MSVPGNIYYLAWRQMNVGYRKDMQAWKSVRESKEEDDEDEDLYETDC